MPWGTTSHSILQASGRLDKHIHFAFDFSEWTDWLPQGIWIYTHTVSGITQSQLFFRTLICACSCSWHGRNLHSILRRCHISYTTQESRGLCRIFSITAGWTNHHHLPPRTFHRCRSIVRISLSKEIPRPRGQILRPPHFHSKCGREVPDLRCNESLLCAFEVRLSSAIIP